MTFHLTDDIVREFEPGGIKNLTGVFILVVWLYGTLMLAERQSGHIIILLGSLLGSVVPVVHMMGRDWSAEGLPNPAEFSSGSGRLSRSA